MPWKGRPQRTVEEYREARRAEWAEEAEQQRIKSEKRVEAAVSAVMALYGDDEKAAYEALLKKKLELGETLRKLSASLGG